MGLVNKYLRGICYISMVERLLLIGHIVNFLVIFLIEIKELNALYAPSSKATKRLAMERDIKNIKSYNKDRMYFSIIKECYTSLVTFFIIGFRLLPRIYNGYFSKLPNSMIFFLPSCLIVKILLIDLPFKIISIFYIEAAYNFNNTTVKTFVFDFFKGIYFLYIRAS